jgi:hypothetical protein
VPEATPTLTVTAQNSDAVAHSTAAAVLALPIAWLSDAKVALTGGPASAGLKGPLAMLRQLRSGIASADRKQALQLLSTGDLPCNFGGTVSGTLDDTDNNGAESPGEVETLVFHNCVGSPNETYDGTVTMRVLDVGADSGSYDVTMSQLSYVTPAHSLMFNGMYRADISGLTSPVQNTTYTVNGSVTIKLATHVPFDDTVTLQNGFVLYEQIDYGLGQSSLSAAGGIDSASAGGSVGVSTVSALTTFGQSGLYPTSGELKVVGKAGSLSIKVLSTSSVRIDVDTNDDGASEKSTTPSWEWVL